MLLPQLLGNDRPDSRLKLRGAHQVGDQDRYRLNACAPHAHIIRLPAYSRRGAGSTQANPGRNACSESDANVSLSPHLACAWDDEHY